MSNKTEKIKKIRIIDLLILLIAILQVIIALPQLKWAYESVSDNDMKKLRQEFVDFRNHNASLSIIQVPDSIMDDKIKIVGFYQKQIFLNSSIISNFYIDTDNIRSAQDAFLWLERFKRVYKLIFENLNIQEKIMELDISPEYTLLKTIYIGVEDFNKLRNTINTFHQSADRFINGKKFDYSDFKRNFPFDKAAQLIKEYDSCNMRFINMLNEYQFKEINHLILPKVGEKGKQSYSISISTEYQQ